MPARLLGAHLRADLELQSRGGGASVVQLPEVVRPVALVLGP